MKKLSLLHIIYLRMMVAVAIGCAATAWAQATLATEQAKPAAANVPAPALGNISSDSITPEIFEYWNTPSLEGSHLKALAPGSLGVDTIDGVYTHEVVRVEWRPIDPIDLYIVKPVGVKNPPVILYLYSYPFETDRFLNHDFCKFLVKDGFAAVGFASALTGQRYHSPRPMKEWFVSQLNESLAVSAHDVQMILNYLASRGDMDMDRVGMFGDGSGATIAILAAGVDPRIETLDLLDPWGDWPDWVAQSKRIPEKERPDFLKPEWLANVAPLDPVKWLPELKSQRIRIQLVKTVTITPADVQRKIEAAAPANAQIVHYDNTEAFRAAVAGGKGFDWIEQQMRSGKAEECSAAGAQPKASSSQAKDSQQ